MHGCDFFKFLVRTGSHGHFLYIISYFLIESDTNFLFILQRKEWIFWWNKLFRKSRSFLSPTSLTNGVGQYSQERWNQKNTTHIGGNSAQNIRAFPYLKEWSEMTKNCATPLPSSMSLIILNIWGTSWAIFFSSNSIKLCAMRLE